MFVQPRDKSVVPLIYTVTEQLDAVVYNVEIAFKKRKMIPSVIETKKVRFSPTIKKIILRNFLNEFEDLNNK